MSLMAWRTTDIHFRRQAFRGWTKNSSARVAASAFAIILARPAIALADDAGDAIETLVVTARKQSEDIQKVPLAVTVLTGKALSDSNDTQIQQLPLKVPGLTVTGSNARQVVFAIRGLGNNPTSDGLSSSVGVYMDGVYLDRPGMAAFDLQDINQVEVLRGPQGTLFGKNTTAGAISITTLAPEFDYGATGIVRFGDWGLRQADISLTGPLSEAFAFRVSAYDTDRNGYLNDLYTGSHLLSLHRQGLRGQVLYRPGPAFSWRVIGEYGREQDSAGAALLYSMGPLQSANPTFVSYATWARNLGISPAADPARLEVASNSMQRITERQYAFTSLMTWNIDAVTLDSVTGWRDWRYRPNIDLDYSSADVLRNGGAANLDRQFSEELRLSGSMFEIHYVLGGYFFWRSIGAESFTEFGSRYSQGLGALGNAALNNGTTRTHSDVANQSYAAFLQGNWQFAPLWTLTAGVRETYETESGTVMRRNFVGGSPPAPPTVGPYNGSFSTFEWTPSAIISIDHALSDSILVYGTSSYGAKAGGFNPAVPAVSGGAFLPIDTLKVKPERTTDIEFGLKSALFDRHVILNVSAYWESVSDYQTSALQLLPNSERKLNITNVGSVLSQGAEADLTANILTGLRLTSSLNYDDAHYGSFSNGPPIEGATAIVQDLSRRPLLLAPAWSFFAGLRYAVPLAPGLSGFLEGELSLKSGYYGYVDDSAYSHVPGTGIKNIQIGVAMDRAELAVWVKNLSDERTFAPVFPAATGAGGYFANPGEPRTVGLTLRYTMQ